MSSNAHVPILNAIQLDESSHVPLYQQLYDAFRTSILTGELAPGFRLPSSRMLAQELSVSRTTTKNAYEQLTAEGYLVGTVGSGTRVSTALPDGQLQAPSPKRRARDAAIRNARLSKRAGSLVRRATANSLHLGNGSAFEWCVPALDEFPYQIWARLYAKYQRSPDSELVGHGDPAGYLPLREALADYLRTARAVNCTPDQIVLVANWLQGIELTSFALFDSGDSVWVEDPGFPASEHALTALGAQVVHVPIDDEGLRIAAGEAKCPGARLAFVNPSHQVPLGVTMSLARRFELLAWASRCSAWILEDDFGCEYRYCGRPIPSLQGLDNSECVIYLGTFNTVLFTALRMAYLVVPESLVDPLLRMLTAQGHHSVAVDQAVLAEFIAEGHFTRHIRRMRTLYADRQAALVAAIRRHLSGIIDIDPDDAGMHLVGWLPPGVDDRQVAEIAGRSGIRLTPVSHFYATRSPRPGVLFGYTCLTKHQIHSGIRRLAKALERYDVESQRSAKRL